MPENKKSNHSCFEWIQLFISISIPVAIAVYTVLENNRDLAIATHNRAQDLDIAYNQQQDLIIQECLKILSKAIETYGSEFNGSLSVSLAARFITLSALNRLDRVRRNFLVRLLYQAKLITYQSNDYHPPVSLHSANLTDLDLVGESDYTILFHLSLEDTIMTRANFHGSNIFGARFNKAILTNADFSGTINDLSFDKVDDIDDINNSQQLFFQNANLTSASFSFAVYDTVDFSESIMTMANLNNFFCENCIFTSTIMDRVNLQNGLIKNSFFMFAELDYTNFYQTNFGINVEFYEANMYYINATYTNFTQCDLSRAKLFNTIFDHAVFINTTFSQAQMKKVSMQYTTIIDGYFTKTDLSQSIWRYAYCERCIFDQANMTDADLSDGVFIDSDFRNCIITNEQLKRAVSLAGSILPNETVFK
jgi:uncharacterized protein YjbI with pentapeptide repeats